MNAITYLDSLIAGQRMSEIPVQLGELKMLRQLIVDTRPVVVIHVEDGCLTGVTTSRDTVAILADYDLIDSTSTGTTPYGYEANIGYVSTECVPEEIAAWVALADE